MGSRADEDGPQDRPPTPHASNLLPEEAHERLQLSLHEDGTDTDDAPPAPERVHPDTLSARTPTAKSSIEITEALKTTEFSTRSYIAYVVVSPQSEAKRRYSEFEALRDALVQLHPTLIIPPIPSKHTLADYALKQGRAKDDAAMIMKRKRLLQRFLRRIDTHPVLGHDSVFRRFLNARYSWHEITKSPPLSTLPKSSLCAPPSNPADPNAPPGYQALPAPSWRPLREPNQRFSESEEFTNRFEKHMSQSVEKTDRRLVRRWTDIATDQADIGAILNGMSLSESGPLANAIERCGQAADASFLATGEMLQQWEALVSEPLHEYTQYAAILQKNITWRHLKHVQLETAQESLKEKRAQLAGFERVEAEANRLQSALEHGGRGLVGRSASLARSRAQAMQQSVYGAAAEDEEPHAAGQGPSESDAPDVRRSSPPAEPHSAPAPDEDSSQVRESAFVPPRGMLGSLRQTVQNIIDVDPERTRKNSITRLREEVLHLEEGVKLAEGDLDYASKMIQASLDLFQRLKTTEIKQLLLSCAKMHRDYCRKNIRVWERARSALDDPQIDENGGMPDATLLPRFQGASSH